MLLVIHVRPMRFCPAYQPLNELPVFLVLVPAAFQDISLSCGVLACSVLLVHEEVAHIHISI